MVSLAEDGMSMICVTHELGLPGGCSSDYFYDEGALGRQDQSVFRAS